MSTHLQKPARSKRRRATHLHALHEQPRPAHKPPSARDTLLAWLMWLPDEAHPQQEALVELERLAARGAPSKHTRELQSLLMEIATTGVPTGN